MKTEHILARVHEILALSDEPTTTRTELAKLADDLAAQVRAEIAAATGAGNAAKTISAMLKHMRSRELYRTALHYGWIDAKGRQCFCDGYRAYRLTEHIPTEDRPADAGTPVDLDKIFPEITPAEYYPLPLPSYADVKTHIALERAENGRRANPLWDFGDAAPTVNAAYLLDVLAVLPDAAEAYVRRGAAGIGSPMVFKGTRGEAILLPIRCQRYSEKTAAAAKVETETNAAEIARREDEKRRRTLLDLLRCYRDELERNPEYALTPDEFAYIARFA